MEKAQKTNVFSRIKTRESEKWRFFKSFNSQKFLSGCVQRNMFFQDNFK